MNPEQHEKGKIIPISRSVEILLEKLDPEDRVEAERLLDINKILSKKLKELKNIEEIKVCEEEIDQNNFALRNFLNSIS